MDFYTSCGIKCEGIVRDRRGHVRALSLFALETKYLNMYAYGAYNIYCATRIDVQLHFIHSSPLINFFVCQDFATSWILGALPLEACELFASIPCKVEFVLRLSIRAVRARSNSRRTSPLQGIGVSHVIKGAKFSCRLEHSSKLQANLCFGSHSRISLHKAHALLSSKGYQSATCCRLSQHSQNTIGGPINPARWR